MKKTILLSAVLFCLSIHSFAIVYNPHPVDSITSGPITEIAMIATYPNPVSEFLHIQFNGGGAPVFITLAGHDGRLLIKKRYKAENEAYIDFKDVPAGVYVLHAEQGHEAYNQQLVVSH